MTIKVTHDGRAVMIDGERRLLVSGAIHYPRSTAEMWPDLIQKAKDGGLDAIESYVFWNIHEPRRRQYDFSGNRDIVRFFKTVQDAGLYGILRLGPGFPVWLHNLPGIETRTDNEIYKNEMKNFTTLIVDMLAKEKLFASQGGPIILSQIENEFGNVQWAYGDKGKSYVNWCAQLAESFNINTCNGYYCDGFTPNNASSPKIWTENWIGWFKAWGERDPHRPAEDVAFAVARFYVRGGSLQSYYMYHGGTNFGHTTGGPYIATSYDYDGCLDEYGNINQPKWGHLKELHLILKSLEKAFLYGDRTITDYRNGVTMDTYSIPNGLSSCFLSNINNDADVTITYNGAEYLVPAWSVSILPDCKQVIYNTAVVNTQTSVMVKKANKAEEEPEELKWTWVPENMEDTVNGTETFDFVASQLLEQKAAASDESDYLWYMTSEYIEEYDPFYSPNMSLRVSTKGHGLYVFFNGELVGSKYADLGNYNFVLEVPVAVKPKLNQITLLSVTLGLQNYGEHFDNVAVGIDGGPVELIGKNNVVKNLSSNAWKYKVGLNGEEKQIFNDPPAQQLEWNSDHDMPINRPFTWYKTGFKAPLGLEPVVVDLQGLGKGEAWINGHSIGRYWPTVVSPSLGCEECGYRGNYGPSRCETNCGQPTQRWYHVPRSFLQADENTLVLFEEAGGNPSFVNFQTVTVGTICANVEEGKSVELSCQGGKTISDVEFASFGDPQGACGSFQKGTCDSDQTLALVKKACVGQKGCVVDVSEATLGATNCGENMAKRLAVQAIC
ncbi:Beta-galactosidase 7 [Asimina triloba]